jgi:hypothetical protein
MELPAGNDPASSRWQREALPLSYGRVVGRDRVELPQRRGGAFTAPWVRQYPAYPCWLRRAESNGLSLGHEPSELPVLHSASNLVGSPRRGAPPDRRPCEKLAEGRGLDPQWLPIHPASNGRLAPAGLTFRNGGRLSARCPYALSVPRGFQPPPSPARLVFLDTWRSAEVTIPTRCRAHRFQNGPGAIAG